jgi:hypothetical protein
MHFKDVSGVRPLATVKNGNHTLFVGGIGEGKRPFLMEEARKRGITFKELEEQMEPSPEQLKAARERQQAIQTQEAKCLAAICEAYWANTPLKSSSLQQLSDTLAATGIVEHPKPAQVKALLLLLPADILGQGIAWGFEDSDVRSQIYRHVDENIETISITILAAGQ